MSETTNIPLYVRNETFEFGTFPSNPCGKFGQLILRKVVEYVRNKEYYPKLTLANWYHICKYKIQADPELGWMYFRMFNVLFQEKIYIHYQTWDKKCDNLRNKLASEDMNTVQEEFEEFFVPTWPFLLFLYIQHTYRIIRKNSGLFPSFKSDENWPRQETSSSCSSSSRKRFDKRAVITEQIQIDFVKTCLADIVNFLEEGEIPSNRIDLGLISAFNIILKFGNGEKDVQKIIRGNKTHNQINQISSSLGYDMKSDTIDRQKFIDFVKNNLIPNESSPTNCIQTLPSLRAFTGTWKESESYSHQIVDNGENYPNNWHVFSSIQDKVLCFKSIPKGSSIKIIQCNNSYLYFPGIYNSISIEKCSNTMLFLGVSSKVTKIVACQDMKVHLISRLFIICDCNNCTFYVHTPCRPIMVGGKCEEITFSPYDSFYPNLMEHIKEANLPLDLSNWTDTLCLGYDGYPLLDTNCWNQLATKEFKIFQYPFDKSEVSSNLITCLPQQYRSVIKENESRIKCWRRQIISRENLSDENIAIFKKVVIARFRNWIKETGHNEELEGLKSLENAILEKHLIGKPINSSFDDSVAEKIIFTSSTSTKRS